MSDRISFAGKIEADGRRLRGSVVLEGSRTFRNGEWLEVDAKALMKADASNVLATIDHDPSKVMGRTSNQTVTLNRTETGIDFETADLPNTTAANDALELARGGYFGGSSFTIDGIRSTFSVDPADGLRVRRINSIKRLTDVALVIDPAFSNSTAAAFSKESTVTAETEVEEQKAPPPAPEAPAKFSEAPKPSEEWAAFARELPAEQIVAQMDALYTAAKGKLSGAELDRYEGFSKALDERRKSDIDAKARAERIEAVHNLKMGRVPALPEAGIYQSDDYKHAFSNYLRSGEKSGMEQFAQSIAGDGTQGGFMVPDEFLTRITERQKAFGGVGKYAEHITTGDGRPLAWPSNDDTANTAVIATEGSAAGSAGADLILGELTLSAYTYDATGASNLPLAVSKELAQDAAFDVGAFVGRKLGERLGRKMAADYATGNGSAKPKGLFDKSADAMTATTMYLALVEHLFQVDQAYRESGNCRWLMSDTIFAKVLNSVDENNRPLFIPAAQASAAGGPTGFILGYPLDLDQGAASLVAFGDINAGYIVRDVKGVMVDVDPYTLISKRQIAYHAWARTDGQIQDTYAVSVSSYSSVLADVKA